jgi:uncharacterized protein (DUF302 family)
MFIERLSARKLTDVEPILRNAARQMGAPVVQKELVNGATVFTIEHPGLYEKLLSADIRFAVFLPCRIAISDYRGGLKLTAISPIQFANHPDDPDVAAAAAALENVLLEILVDLEDTEGTDQPVDMADTVPQRFEDQAGTGEQDSPGG